MTMSKLIISLVGRPGTGKSSVAKHLEEKYGFTPFTFSTIIREYAAKNGIELTKRADYAATHAKMIAEHGWDYTLRIALSLSAKRICVDDLRSPKYAEVLRAAGGHEIAFDCPAEVRFAHVQEHGDKVKYPATFDEFMQAEHEDDATVIGPGLKFEIDELMKLADYHADASGSLEHTFEQVDVIVEALLNEHRKAVD